MVAHLVCHHVALGEVAVGPQLVAHLLIEGEIDVDGAIRRAVEGAHHRLALAAAGTGCAAIEHQLGGLIAAAALLEDFAPGILGGGEHHRGEPGEGIFGRLRHLLTLGLALGGRLAEQGGEVHPVVAGHHDHHQQDQTPLAADGDAAPAALLAPVFHIVAFTAILPAHMLAPLLSGGSNDNGWRGGLPNGGRPATGSPAAGVGVYSAQGISGRESRNWP